MSTVTRHALRVYSALSELKESSGDDVLDALVPFFEPVLEVMNGKLFVPRLFAVGVQKLYRWRFTTDIAEHFIPRLVRKGYLVKQNSRGTQGIYTVRFIPQSPSTENIPIVEVLKHIVDEFERFPPRITDLLTYSRTRAELEDILIRFLVSMDAYGETSFAAEVQRLQFDVDEKSTLAALADGGTPLLHVDKYMCARFVKHISVERPEFVPHLARLASIGLLTEVVEDFAKPIQPPGQVNLTIAVDAPLALDFLGCSGTSLQKDVKNIFDALKAINCSFIVFPVTCEEMQRNLNAMLSKRPSDRYGYTHDAIVRREVLPEFVQAVAKNPEAALERVGIQVKPLSLDQFPNSYVYFDHARYEDFFSSVYWVGDVPPREHDATCLALLVRLRAGKHHSDLFRCGYALVTRNATFVKESRKYCVDNHIINSRQEGPVIHQRQLATMAWLRTGLGASEQIPRGHLMAICERVLRVRMEVREAVGNKLRQVTPDKLEQYELLLQDHRSLSKLADATLNDESVVTTENAERVLEIMRKATVEEEREQFERKLQAEQSKHREAQRKTRAEAKRAVSEAERAAAERDLAHAALAARSRADQEKADHLAEQISRRASRIERITAMLFVGLGVLAVIQYLSGWLTSLAWTFVAAAAGFVGLYDSIMTRLERPKIGIPTMLRLYCRWALRRKLEAANLPVSIDDFDFCGSKIFRKTSS